MRPQAAYRFSAFDHLLAGIAAALTSYSSLASIGRTEIGLQFAAACIVFCLIGSAIRSVLSPETLGKWSGPAYVICGFLVFLVQRPLNSTLPDNGFPNQILLAGTFTWMVMIALLFAWQDSTLCFQAVPSIAIFGLVGAFDTFKAAPWLFFVFLLCTTALFFRAHARSMLKAAGEALESGPEADPDDVAAQVGRMGAWRWMAGPGWALGSALLIVLFSLFGAPVIQQSVRTVRGEGVQLIPPSAIRTNPVTNSQNFGGREALRVGNGPTRTEKTPVLKVRTPAKTSYLRGETYAIFTGRGWAPNPRVLSSREAQQPVDPEVIIPDGESVGVSVVYLSGIHTRIYTPGEFLQEFQPQLRAQIFPDGTVGSVFVSAGVTTQFFARVPTGSAANSRAAAPPFPGRSDAWANPGPVSARVERFAADAMIGGKTDFTKLQRLERQIGYQCNYNLQAPEIARDKNVVDEFLFEIKEGYCDLFATAFTVAARSQGYYARVCTGFLIQPQSEDAEGYKTILDADYHMWSEVYFDRVGWVAFDPTRFAQNVSPQDTREAVERRNRWILAFGVLLGAPLVWFVGRRMWSDLRRPAKLSGGVSPAERVAQSYFRWMARATGKPRRLVETPREYLARIENALADKGQHQAFLNQIEAALYGPQSASASDLQHALRELQRTGVTRHHED